MVKQYVSMIKFSECMMSWTSEFLE